MSSSQQRAFTSHKANTFRIHSETRPGPSLSKPTLGVRKPLQSHRESRFGPSDSDGGPRQIFIFNSTLTFALFTY